MSPANTQKRRHRSEKDKYGVAWRFFKELFYFMIIVVLVMGVGGGYLLWLRHYGLTHPKIVQAAAVDYLEELPLEGVLLWEEGIMAAPGDGIVTYLSLSPRRVAKGDTVAKLDNVPVKADAPGYFFPALDGQEGQWTYARLWQGVSLFPEVEPAKFLPEKTRLTKGEPLGKLVPQPQELRCIAYLDKTLALEDEVKNGFISIKTESEGKSQKAVVRTVADVGLKYKLYLTLPFFPPELLMTRAFSCSVLTENRQGVSVPISAVKVLDGKYGVLLLNGGILNFVEVEGLPMEGDNFFITKGITAGDVVVLQAYNNNPGDAVIAW